KAGGTCAGRARASAPASSNASGRARLVTRFIQSAEVVQDQTALFGIELLEHIPRRIRIFGTVPARPERRRHVQAVVLGRRALTIFLLVGLLAVERTARVEQMAEQPFLALHGGLIELPRLEAARQFARFVGQGARRARL